MNQHEIINLIGSCFNLTKSELNMVINLKLSHTKHAYRRIFDLHGATEEWINRGLPKPTKEQLHSPQLKEQSLFDTLCEDIIDGPKISFIGSRLYITNSTIL